MGLKQSRLNRRSTTSRVGATRKDQTKKEDLVIFLDLDNTLIFTEFLDDHDGKEAEGENVLISALEPGIEGRKITVYKRPHLDFFLQQVSTRFAQVNIFTAASKGYADCILNRLDPMGTIFTKRWYRDSCTGPQHDLRKDVLSLDIKVDPKRFVLVDDNGFHMLDNPCNGIVVARFGRERLDENDDDVLLQVLRLLKKLDGHKDVRPRLEKQFQLPLVKMMLEDCDMKIGPISIG